MESPIGLVILWKKSSSLCCSGMHDYIKYYPLSFSILCSSFVLLGVLRG